MKRFVRIARLAALAGPFGAWLLVGAEASAVTLRVEWELVIQVGTGSAAAPITATGTGVAIANGSGGAGALTNLALSAGMIATTGLIADIDDPAAAPFEGLVVTVANGAGTFAIGSGGHLAGEMPLPGLLRACLFADCGAAPANLSLPLTPIGVGGTAHIDAGSVSVTVTGAPWTTGTVMAAGIGPAETWTGWAQGPASAPSSTARVGGTLQLVTPFAIHTSIPADAPSSGFAFLGLRFVPEPATALLGTSGIVALAQLGRRRLGRT